MQAQERQLAEAAAELTTEDLQYLEEKDMLPEEEPASENTPHTQEESPSEASSQKSSTEESSEDKKSKRRNVEREWPDVGAILEADYKGQHYEAEVISMPRYKSGKAIRILTGPASGEVERSMSGAMLTATEKQREENDLGRSGVANGWKFWSVKDSGHE